MQPLRGQEVKESIGRIALSDLACTTLVRPGRAGRPDDPSLSEDMNDDGISMCLGRVSGAGRGWLRGASAGRREGRGAGSEEGYLGNDVHQKGRRFFRDPGETARSRSEGRIYRLRRHGHQGWLSRRADVRRGQVADAGGPGFQGYGWWEPSP